MEDQFGGRTDDDLFFDEFEPVGDIEDEIGAVPTSVLGTLRSPSAPIPSSTTPDADGSPAPVPRPTSAGPSASRFVPGLSTAAAAAAATTTAATAAGSNSETTTPARSAQGDDWAASPTGSPPPPPPTGPSADRDPDKPAAVLAASASSAARLGSGANPRTKLTETELAAKMEHMRLLNAETTRKFEQASRDEQAHAEAYARGMEEARKRRAADADRRRRADDDRMKMESEREKNRERKLRAMIKKEGGWDDGKQQEEPAPPSFRGANGGVRGTTGRPLRGLADSRFAGDDHDTANAEPTSSPRGLASSRYAQADSARPDSPRDRDRGGRGRGRGRAGRGGPGGGGRRRGERVEWEPRGHQEVGREVTVFDDSRAQPSTPAGNKPTPSEQAFSSEDFPALPGSQASGENKTPALETGTASTSNVVPARTAAAKPTEQAVAVEPPIGKWDEEVEAMEAGKQS